MCRGNCKQTWARDRFLTQPTRQDVRLCIAGAFWVGEVGRPLFYWAPSVPLGRMEKSEDSRT
jgi:hypothetical protein